MANRVLLGKGTSARGTSDYGLWVSKPGQDVLTCTDDNLIFDMDKGGTADIKGMFQLQTITGTATASTINNVQGNATTTISFTNFGWGFGVVPFLGLAALTSGDDGGQVQGSFKINSFNTSGVNVTNLESTAKNISISVLPFFSNNARF